ncbi:MAG: RNA polymerase sigma factor, partial [Solirubrobacteraceae bacterium]
MSLPPFQSLLDAHGRDVHRFLVATIGASDADDCYQETWIAALRAYPRLRDASNLRGWLLTIAHRKAIDSVRARARRATPVAEPAELPAA